MITCKDCRYWKIIDNYHDPIAIPIDQDTFEPMNMPFEVKQCTCNNITLFERNPNSNGVSLQDGSGFMAKMYTGEDYGCVNACRLTTDESSIKEIT